MRYLRLCSKGDMGERGEMKKRVVVVGGGVAGASLAYSIQDVAEVVVIDQKEYFEIAWGCLRAIVEPSFAERLLVNHRDYLPKAKICVSTAINVSTTEVFTADGSVFPYDFLVIATGHLESVPENRTARLNYFKEEYEKLKSSNSVLIIGGGPTAVELAGEIAVDFPEKRVKLVHRGSRLLEFIGVKASTKALDWLTSKKVEVILNQSIDTESLSNGIFQTSGGEVIEADCHFVCTGKPKGSSWLRESILRDSLDVKGALMVDENLRIRGQQNIFAIGDITDIPEIKQGYLAHNHAAVVAKNLKLLFAGTESNLATYKPGSAMAIVSLGRREAVAQIMCVTLCGWIPGKIKSGDLFVGKTRKQLGLSSS